MKFYRLFALALAVVMAATLCSCAAVQKDTPPGTACPSTQLTEIDQNGYTDRTFDPTALGKITVINFWAHWCGPCVRELPHFEQVAREYADEVAIVAVHCDTVESAQSFIADGYSDSAILFAMDQENEAFAYYSALGGTGSIPYTVVLDENGSVRKTFVGAITYDALVNAINECR